MSNELKRVDKPMICPLIESSEHLEDVQNVVELYESLQSDYGNEKLDYYMGK